MPTDGTDHDVRFLTTTLFVIVASLFIAVTLWSGEAWQWILPRLLLRQKIPWRSRTLTRVQRERVQLLDDASRQLTEPVSEATKLAWIHTLIIWNKQHASRSESEFRALIRFLGGVLWFRFHVRCDYAAVHTMSCFQPAFFTCNNLLLWALEATVPLHSNHSRDPTLLLSIMVMDTVNVLSQIGLTTIDEETVQFLLESVVEQHVSSSSSMQIVWRHAVRACLGHLNVLYESSTTEWTVGCHAWSPLCVRHNAQVYCKGLVSRLERHVRTTHPTRSTLSSLMGTCTTMKWYTKAIEQWQNTAWTVPHYFVRSQPSPWMHGAEQWIHHGRSLRAYMRQGLCSHDDVWWKQGLVHTSRAVVAQSIHVHRIHDEDAVLYWVDGLSILAAALGECHCWTDAMSCWERASQLLEPVFVNSCRQVSDRLWYLGIVLVSRNGNVQQVGLDCLSWSTKLGQTPSVLTLKQSVQFIVDHCIRTECMTSLSPSDRIAAQKGADFALDALWSSLQAAYSVGGRMAHVCNSMSMEGSVGPQMTSEVIPSAKYPVHCANTVVDNTTPLCG